MSIPDHIYDIRNQFVDTSKVTQISSIGKYQDSDINLLKGHDPSSHKDFILIESNSVQIEISNIETLFLLKRALDKALEFGWIK